VNEERDRFLTKAMGTCRHDYDPDDYINTYSLEGYVRISSSATMTSPRKRIS
jgi:hypothetical protein